MKGGFFGLADDDAFWQRPMARQDKVLGRMLDRKPGLLLDGPTDVTLPLRQSLPVVVGLVASYADLHGLDPGRTGVVVAVNVDTTEVWTGTLEDVENVEENEDPGPPPALAGVGSLLFFVDARARTKLPWAQGASFAVSVCLRDRASNRLRVALGAGPQAYVDPAVQELVLARRRAFALRIAPESEEGGPDLTAARSPTRSVAVRPWERVRPKRPGDPELDRRVSAIVPVALLVTGAVDAAPRVLELRVPIVVRRRELRPGHWSDDHPQGMKIRAHRLVCVRNTAPKMLRRGRIVPQVSSLLELIRRGLAAEVCCCNRTCHSLPRIFQRPDAVRMIRASTLSSDEMKTIERVLRAIVATPLILSPSFAGPIRSQLRDIARVLLSCSASRTVRSMTMSASAIAMPPCRVPPPLRWMSRTSKINSVPSADCQTGPTYLLKPCSAKTAV